MSVQRLGYVGFEVSDVSAWRSYATGMLGAMLAAESATSARFRIDSRAWRFSVHQGAADDITYIGFEVPHRDALMAMAERLRKVGCAIHDEDPRRAHERGVLGLISCNDPFGTHLELYYGATEVFEAPFVSPAGVSQFVTGDQGIGHIVLNVPDLPRALAFYTEGLGLHLSDVIDWHLGDGATASVYFLHCNGRHHTLALLSLPMPKKLHHFMLEVGSLDNVGHAYDRFENNEDHGIVMTMGRHTNDHMVSFYGTTPSGFAVEYGWGARQVEPGWSVVRYDSISMWGHRFVGPKS